MSEGGSGWWLAVCGLLNNFGWLFGILPTVFLLPLLFPDGRLPTPRWRPFLWFIVAFLALIAVSLVLGQRTLTGSNQSIGIANPFYVDAIGRLPKPDPLIGVLFPLIFVASLTSLVLRFRRSKGVERQQIKWVVFGLVVALVGIVATGFTSSNTIPTALVARVAFLLFPASIGVAVLRFHLYDLDVVVRKTLVYGAFALFATLIYLAIVVGVGAWLGRDNSLLTMVAAVVVGAHVPAHPSAPDAIRESARVREARHAVRDPVRVLRTRGRRVCGRGRAAADGARPGRRGRSRTGRCVARRRSGAARCRDLASGR